MTRVKSLKVKKGYQHRVHRSKKNRRATHDYNGFVLYKKKKETLKFKDIIEDELSTVFLTN